MSNHSHLKTALIHNLFISLGDIMQSLLEEGGASASASSPTLLASEEVD